MQDTSVTPNQQPTSAWDRLTVREQQIALMLGRGITTREIAKELGISPKTVDTHRLHVLEKLIQRNAVSLARYLIREGKLLP